MRPRTSFRNACWIALLLIVPAAAGPFAPPPGQSGTTAIYSGSSDFIAWATSITVERGPIDIRYPDGPYANHGGPNEALGPAEKSKAAGGDVLNVVSLGDGGIATLTFDVPITNAPGYDFAVFENGHSDSFLELAFVEVSSDGIHFFRFDSVSLTPTNWQVAGFGQLDATNIHNLAGKYPLGYGTPFDLDELKDVHPLLDVNAVTHVRVIDVVGYVQPADIVGDGIVNMVDYAFFAAAYGSGIGDAAWNQDCDMHREWITGNPGYFDAPDGIVDVNDLQVFMAAWLEQNEYSSSDAYRRQINDPWPTPFQNPDLNTYTGGFDLDAVGVINQKTE